MRNIVILKWNLINVDGAEKVSVNLANELSNLYNVHYISIINDKDTPFFRLKPEINYKTYTNKISRARKVILKGNKFLRRYLKENNIDIVISIGVGSNMFAYPSTIGTEVRLITCDHVSLGFNLEGKKYKILRYLSAKFSEKIITLTEKDKEEYKKKYKISSGKIDNIYNWIEYQENNVLYNKNSKKIITVGRISKQKGYDLLIEVAQGVLKKNKDWIWDIYGEGDEVLKEQLIKKIENYEISDRLKFKGVVKNMDKYYSDYSLYVMTSYFEGLPMVLLEAQKYKLPIVSFDCPTGPKEIIEDNINGNLVECYKVKDMIKKINELIINEEKRVNFSSKSQINMIKFQKDEILKKWESIIENK